jgi:hypothetical protein
MMEAVHFSETSVNMFIVTAKRKKGIVPPSALLSLAYFTYSGKNKKEVCEIALLSVCTCVSPPNPIIRQRLRKHALAATNTHARTE